MNRRLMTVDQAIATLRTTINEHCKNAPQVFDVFAALEVMTYASEALNEAHKVMSMHLNGDFDKDLHGLMQINAIRSIDPLIK